MFTQSAILKRTGISAKECCVLSLLWWILTLVRFSAIVLLYCFLALQVFLVYKYKITLANWQTLLIFVTYQHQTRVPRSIVYNITISSVTTKHKFYNFKILNMLIAPITIYLCCSETGLYLLYLLFFNQMSGNKTEYSAIKYLCSATAA